MGTSPWGYESELLSLLAIHGACHRVASSIGSSERHAQLARNSRAESALPVASYEQSCAALAASRLSVTPAGRSRNQRYDRVHVTRSDSSVVGTADLVDEQQAQRHHCEDGEDFDHHMTNLLVSKAIIYG